jgi:hypothetical protein
MSIASEYEGYKWIKVQKYKMDETKSWEERYAELDRHHIAETTFLIEKVRELAAKVDDCKMHLPHELWSYGHKDDRRFTSNHFPFGMTKEEVVDSLIKEGKRIDDNWLVIKGSYRP